MHEVLVNRLGGLSLPRKSVVWLTDRPNMTLDVYHGRKTTTQQPFQVVKYAPALTTKYPCCLSILLDMKNINMVKAHLHSVVKISEI